MGDMLHSAYEYDDETKVTQYIVTCPTCRGPATGVMQAGPIVGDYRGTHFKYVPSKIICPCGHTHILPTPYDSSRHDLYRYDLYLKADVSGHDLWVTNREHAVALRDFIEGNRALATRLDGWYALPQWMLQSKKRHDVIKSLNRLIALADRITI